jgi:hypothetical protein
MSTTQNQSFRDVLFKTLSQTNPNEWESLYFPFEKFEMLFEQGVAGIPNAKKMEIGRSKYGRPIYELQLGKGPKKLFIWSQMHGDEASGTRAILNFIHAISQHGSLFTNVLNQITIVVIPVLNPDGATAYTRRNVEGIDLNRDAKACFSSETAVLQGRILHHQPDLALNLHDQRSIFGLKGSADPAVMSFLNPSFNLNKELSDSRRFGMRVIASIYQAISEQIPNAVGRYTDDYYPTAMGEWVQEKGISCILVEAGMSSGDWMKRIPVQLHAHVFTQSIAALLFDGEDLPDAQEYFNIPEMNQNFVDVLFDKTQFFDTITNVNSALMRRYRVENGDLKLEWVLQDFGDLTHVLAHERKPVLKLKVDIDYVNRLIGNSIDKLIEDSYD